MYSTLGYRIRQTILPHTRATRGKHGHRGLFPGDGHVSFTAAPAAHLTRRRPAWMRYRQGVIAPAST